MNEATMLALAGIAYRGFNLVYPEPLQSRRLRALMDECMANFLPLTAGWEIVWGPVSFRATSVSLADAVMYVAENQNSRRSLAIAMRGTNPISLSDWLFGDLLVSQQEPWTYAGTPSGKISVSSAFGLGILKLLRWDESIIEPGARAPAPAGSVPGPGILDRWRDPLRATAMAAELLATITRRLADAPDALGKASDLLRQIAAEQSARPGTTLKQFLAAYINQHGACDVYVTGHSKGGALASTLALWLADTRGPQENAAEQWNPDPKAPIHYYSFASPTVGDSAFADHTDAVLTDSHRIWNQRDVVPRAFIPADLCAISVYYGLRGAERLLIDELTNHVASAVADLNYQHSCRPGDSFDPAPLPDRPLLPQIIHQHLEGYLERNHLTTGISTATLFTPAV